MNADIENVLIRRDKIDARVRELAKQITIDHSPPVTENTRITIVPILTGAVIFCADLIRELPMKMRIGLLTVSSYPGTSVRSQGARILGEQLGDIQGHHVLVVDDILDSGGTLRRVVPTLLELGAATVKTCVLLRKDRPAARETPVDYVGFEIPDAFVAGYGLDYNDYYRNLPDIVTLKPDIFSSEKQ